MIVYRGGGGRQYVNVPASVGGAATQPVTVELALTEARAPVTAETEWRAVIARRGTARMLIEVDTLPHAHYAVWARGTHSAEVVPLRLGELYIL